MAGMSTPELDVDLGVAPGLESVPDDAPAQRKPCEKCRRPTLLRPGGLCAGCIATIGLAADQDEYRTWRRRVDDAVTAGPGR